MQSLEKIIDTIEIFFSFCDITHIDAMSLIIG